MVFCAGRIVAKRAASPTVTVLDLHVPSLASFLPGQWVDFMAPPHTWIGGFSLASSPKDLPLLTLAVKASSQEPSKWVTYKSQVGDAVQVQVGGSSVLRQDDDKPAVFVAGGIGISPLLSMYRQYTQERGKGEGQQARFLHLVSNEEELVFIDELVQLASENGDGLVLSLTQQDEWKRPLKGATCLVGRDVMRTFLQSQASQNTIYYICGPPTMLDEAIDLLEQEGVPSSNVVYEKWW